MRAPAAAAVMPPPNPIAALYDIPVKKGAEAQLAKAAEAEARGKKRTAAQLDEVLPKAAQPAQLWTPLQAGDSVPRCGWLVSTGLSISSASCDMFVHICSIVIEPM